MQALPATPDGIQPPVVVELAQATSKSRGRIIRDYGPIS